MPNPTDALIYGKAQRGLPAPSAESLLLTTRTTRYGELVVELLSSTRHALVDEGSYYTANNNQSGLATAAAQNAFSATASAFLLIQNTGSASDPNAKRIYLDYVQLMCTAAGTNGTAIFAALVLDNTLRYSSGGTLLTNNNANMDVATSASVSKVYAGGGTPLVCTAATNNARTIVGQRLVKNAIGVANDSYLLQFGGDLFASVSATTIITSQNLPPVVIGPQQSAMLHIWLPSQSVASSYMPEVGWWER
jgi:hypothetical protein